MGDEVIDLLNKVSVEPELLHELATVTWPTADSLAPSVERSQRVCEEVWQFLVQYDRCAQGTDPMDMALAITARIFALHWWVGEHRPDARWYGHEALFKAACTEPLCPIDGQALFDPEKFEEALALALLYLTYPTNFRRFSP